MANTATIWAINNAAAGGWSGPTTNLTHRYPLEDANVSGTTVTDVIGSLNGTSSPGALSSVAGPGTHTARSFNGSSELIALASSPLPSSMAAHSVFMWVYADSTGSLSTVFGDFQSTGNNVRFAVDIDGSLTAPGSFFCHLQKGGVDFDKSSDSPLSLNAFHCIGYTWDGTSTLKLYADGSVATSTGSSGSGTVGSNHTLGARGDGSGFLKGREYQVLFYDAEVSGATASAIYTAQ